MTGLCLASGVEAERKPDIVNEGSGEGSRLWKCVCGGEGAEGSGAKEGGVSRVRRC